MGARICPRCSTRVDERRAKTSPYCLSCGAPLGTPPPTTFAGKQPGGGAGSALPWILGAVGLAVLLGFGGCLALIAIGSSASSDDAKPVAVGVGAQPKVETPSTATATVPGTPPGTVKTPAPIATPNPRPTVVATSTARPTATPFSIPTPPPPLSTPTVTTPPPFPRAKAQAEVDRVSQGLTSCKRSTGPFGAGSIRVDFEPDGRVGTLSRPPFSGTPVGSCISSRFLGIRIGAFQGSTQQIEKAFIIQE
jgi:hypothetical protein